MNFEFGSYGYIAQKDMGRAEKLLAVDEFDAACFYAHQALERIAKQYIRGRFLEEDISAIMKTHKLQEIYSKIENSINLKGEIEAIVDLLDSCYNTRYLGENYVEIDEHTARAYVRMAVSIMSKVEGLLDSAGETSEFS